jgi:superkiller protein 3
LSRVLLDSNRPEDALTKIDEALTIDPQLNTAFRLRGRAFHQLGLVEEAIDAYRQAILIDDQDAWAMNNLGLIFIEEELFDQALPPLARAVELRDDVAIFQNNLGMALEHAGHFRSANEAYEAAVSIDGSYEKASLNFSRVDAVVEETDLEPLDLEYLAESFNDVILGWRDAMDDSECSESVEADSKIVSVADSTDSTLE